MYIYINISYIYTYVYGFGSKPMSFPCEQGYEHAQLAAILIFTRGRGPPDPNRNQRGLPGHPLE